MTEAAAGSRLHRWWPWLGGLVGIAALVWVLRRFDLERFLVVLASADARFLALVPLAIAVEQLVRAWKWRQILYPIKPVGTWRLFGTIMASYLAGLLIPFGFSALARAWLVARREDLTTSGVLATVAIDRFTDGVVFALLVPVALLLVAFPDPGGDIRAALTWGAAGSLVLFAALLLALAAYKRAALRSSGRLLRLLDHLPDRAARAFGRIAASFAEGIVWPREFKRGFGIVFAAVVIKLIAATHFLWAGFAFGVVLQPGQYLFLIVFLGFLVILGHFARIPGSFIIGAVFALGLFGVMEEPALALALTVQAASVLTVAGIGAFALWRQGVALADLRGAGAQHAGSS